MNNERTGPVAIYGYAVTGEAVARAMTAQKRAMIAIDDRRDAELFERARADGVELVQAPDEEELEKILGACSMAVVSPGVPPSHPLFPLCARLEVPVTTEVEIAAEMIPEDTRLVAVTGTNGKTTVVTLICRMLREASVEAVAAGNIGVPVVDALGSGAPVIVAEVSSFQLALTRQFRPDVAVWLNISPDHLDAHLSFEDYVESKARIWANQRPGDVAVVNAEDPIVLELSARAPSSVVTFGLERGDYRVEGEALSGPEGEIVPVDRLARRFPHDLANGLAAVAAAFPCGASADACARVLESFTGLPHRVELVAESGGVRYFDDSKATTPASVVAALQGLSDVVLLAGGRNKGLDFSPLRECIDRLRAVVAIGESAAEVAAIFENEIPVTVAGSMSEAVRIAVDAAHPGSSVLLSPGCASFDWYKSYAERGDDFARHVKEMIGVPG